MKPIYNHDCDKCQYLRTGYYGLKESDFYHCDGKLIIRQSGEPSDYACYTLSLLTPSLINELNVLQVGK